MPSEKRFVVALRGEPAWEKALDRLRKSVNKAIGIDLENAHQLAEYALGALAERHEIKLPRRIAPMGRQSKKGD